MNLRTRIGMALSGLALVIGLILLHLAQAVDVEPTVTPWQLDNEAAMAEAQHTPEAEDFSLLDFSLPFAPEISAQRQAMALQADNDALVVIQRPIIAPPAQPAVQSQTLNTTAANPAPFASPASRADWPKTTAETTLAPLAKNPPTDGKWIDVNLSRQTVTAYVDSTPIKTVLTSTGTRIHPTVIGTYRVYARVPSQTMTGGSRARGDYYRLPGVPNIMYFYQGYGLHGTYWHRNFGHPMSHGCVNLTLDDAKWFYDWTPMSTFVVSHY